MILTQMIYSLFGYQSKPPARGLIKVLERDLDSSLSSRTLFQQMCVFSGGVAVALLVRGGGNDIISAHEL